MMTKLDQYHQKQQAINIFGGGFIQGASKTAQLNLLALYMRDYCDMKGEVLKTWLTKFCEKNIDNYHYRSCYQMINGACRYADNKSHCLIQIDSIPVYQSEVDYIISLGLTPKEEKIMFTIMMVKKLDKECFLQRHQGEQYSMMFLSSDDEKLKSVKRLTGITSRLNLPLDVFYPWKQMGIINVTHTGFILNFMGEIVQYGDIIMQVKSYNNFGVYWDCIAAKQKRGMCHCCGKPFKPSNNKAIYCGECSRNKGRSINELPPVKSIICDKCGQEFYVDARNAKTTICRRCKALAIVEES